MGPTDLYVYLRDYRLENPIEHKQNPRKRSFQWILHLLVSNADFTNSRCIFLDPSKTDQLLKSPRKLDGTCQKFNPKNPVFNHRCKDGYAEPNSFKVIHLIKLVGFLQESKYFAQYRITISDESSNV
ncbi:hypothetical protein RF11_05240 [Thelohanellus kitauei]|uniref:Uncharacterized protein n=1 Tax=Thelohanellus kitauei TaxID=669202 RepID=A0A0C2I921_THEKT|nr:hypothetical protein RF11_05240 [Thelohanellus kitauei]